MTKLINKPLSEQEVNLIISEAENSQDDYWDFCTDNYEDVLFFTNEIQRKGKIDEEIS